MNRYRSTILLALSMATVFAVADDAVVMKRTLTESEKSEYNLDSVFDASLDLSAVGQSTMDFSVKSGMKIVFTTGKVDKEKKLADVKGKVTDFKMDMQPDMGGMGGDTPTSFEFLGKMNETGGMSDVKVDGLNGMTKQMMGGTLLMLTNGFVFSATAVKPGDTWKLPKVGKTEFGDVTSDLTAKFVGAEKVGTIDAYKITVKGTMKNVFHMAAGEGPMGEMTTTSDTKVESTIFVDKATGKTLKYNSQGTVVSNVDAGGMTIPMKGSFTSVMLLSSLKEMKKEGTTVKSGG